MRFFYLLIFISILSCEKERCYTVEGKRFTNGEYYLLLQNSGEFNRSYNNLGNNNLTSGVPDPYGTGKVDKETYESVSEGEKYCP